MFHEFEWINNLELLNISNNNSQQPTTKKSFYGNLDSGSPGSAVNERQFSETSSFPDSCNMFIVHKNLWGKRKFIIHTKNQKLSQNFNTIFKGWDVCFQKTYDLTRILRVNIYCNTQEILMPIKLCWVEIFTKQWKIFVSNLMNYNFKNINSEPIVFFCCEQWKFEKEEN